MVKAELELYEEQCNGVAKKLKEATANLQKINEDKEAKQRCCKSQPGRPRSVIMCLFSELVSLREARAAKKEQLLKAERDMESITVKEEKLCKQLKNVRLQVDEAKSALQAQQNK